MPTGIFEFQSMLTSAVNGISGNLLGTEQSVSYVLMTICLVLGIYEAYTRGGDLRSLAGTLLKYTVAAFLIGNWTAFFSDLFSGFNQLASAIDGAYGAVDLAQNWQTQLATFVRAYAMAIRRSSVPPLFRGHTFRRCSRWWWRWSP